MKLLTTIAAVLISISAYSQDLIEYNNGTFTKNGEELSMDQIDDLTVLHKAGRGNFRRGDRFDRMYKDRYLRFSNNRLNFLGGAVTGYFGVLPTYYSVIGTQWAEDPLGPLLFGAGTGLCVVSYKAFSRIALSKKGCLRKRYKAFNKVADKLNEAIMAANQ
jgi:hypothetical protein